MFDWSIPHALIAEARWNTWVTLWDGFWQGVPDNPWMLGVAALFLLTTGRKKLLGLLKSVGSSFFNSEIRR